MDQVDITLGRALKIWWSFVWRSTVLSLVVVIPLQIFLVSVMVKNIPPAGTQPDPQTVLKMMSGLMLAWPVVMATMIALQAQGMRWMIRKARWSDFRLAVVPRDQQT